jgi:hemoglobin-like flavoprotein
MTPESEELVRQSWFRISKRSAALAERFYGRLFELAPDHRLLFAATDMPTQQRKFIAMLHGIVNHLSTPDRLVPEVAALGARHVGYGVKTDDYGVVGEALLWALEAELGPAMTPAHRQAWRDAYQLTARLMQRGAGAGTTAGR